MSKFRHCTRRGGWGSVLLLVSLIVLAACSPPSAAQRLERANTALAQGDYRVAAIEARNVLQQAPGNLEARIVLGAASFGLRDWEGAVRELTVARDGGAAPAVFAVTLAEALARLGRIDEAFTELERLPDDRRDATWFTRHGEISALGGLFEQAEASFRRAMEIDGGYPAALGWARVAIARRAWDEAVARADRAIALQAEIPDAYFIRGVVELERQNLTSAERDFARAAELWATGAPSGDEINNLFALARVQLALRRVEGLAATAARARERAPDSPVAGYASGAFDFVSGKYSEAVAKLQRVATASPDNLEVQVLLGAASLAAGSVNQAEQHLLTAFNARPDDADAGRLLAEARRRQGRPRDALDIVERLPGADADVALLALRGALHLEAGDPAESVPLLERALQTLPSDTGLRLQLARAYTAMGREGDATGLFAGEFDRDLTKAIGIAVRLLDNSTTRDDPAALAADVIAESPDDEQTLFGAGLFLHLAGFRDEASALFRRAAEADPAFTSPVLVMAGIALRDGDLDVARRLYEEATMRSPNDFRAWIGLAQVAQQSGFPDEALRYARRGIEANPGEVAPQLFLGRLAVARGDRVAARAAADEALRIDRTNPDARTLAGELALEDGAAGGAVEHFRAAAAVDPRRPERWHNLARAQFAARDLESAKSSLVRAAELMTTRSPAVRLDLARVEHALGNTEVAHALAHDLQADFPGSSDGLLLEAQMFVAERDHARAAETFDRAYARGASFEAAAGSYAARRAGRLPDPTAPLAEWLNVSPDDDRAWTLLGEFRHAQGDAEQALEAFERAIAAQPRNVVALNNAAWLLTESGEPRAVEYGRRAHELAPDTASVADTYAWSLLRTAGDAEVALSLLRKASRDTNGGAPEIEYHLAYALMQTSQRAEALTVVRRALAAPGDFASRKDAEALLEQLE